MTDTKRPQIDHLVVGAAELDAGIAWMTERLGAPPAARGRHALMGTHNGLWRIGPCYLEVIAVDPEAPAPGRPRWYGLDDPHTQARFARTPALITWVVSVPALDAWLPRVDPAVGPPVAVTRDQLSWKLTVPDDGRLVAEGAMPTLIAWDPGSASPAGTLAESGATLQTLHVTARDGRVADALATFDLGPLVGTEPGAEALSAHLTRSDGSAVRL